MIRIMMALLTLVRTSGRPGQDSSASAHDAQNDAAQGYSMSFEAADSASAHEVVRLFVFASEAQ
jgi:hypothetical protein